MSTGVHLDLSMDILEEMRFRKKHADLIKKLSKELHFTYEELECILLIYYKIQKQNTEKLSRKHVGITKCQLNDILHNGMDMTDTELTNRLFIARGPYPTVPMELWARYLSLFLRGTLEEKIKHCYPIYDVMDTGKIGRDTMLGFLDNSIIAQSSEDDSEDAVKDMCEILCKKMDLDRDGKISFDDYRKSCLNQPLLLEALGPVLPTRIAVHTFLTSFTPHIGKL